MKCIFVLVVIFLLVACTEDNPNSQNMVNKSSQSSQSTGNQFKDAAIKKINQANPDMSYEQSLCMVEDITADGKIGLGEVNMMNLDPEAFSKNASGIVKAYQGALRKCQ